MTLVEIASIAVPVVLSVMGVGFTLCMYLGRKLGGLSSGQEVLATRIENHEEHCETRWNNWAARHESEQKAWGRKWDDHYRLHDAEKER